MIFSGSKLFISSTDWDDKISCFLSETLFISSLNKLRAAGCKPSSGSSMIIVSGMSSNGWSKSVARQINLSVPSDKIWAFKGVSGSDLSNHSSCKFSLSLIINPPKNGAIWEIL